MSNLFNELSRAMAPAGCPVEADLSRHLRAEDEARARDDWQEARYEMYLSQAQISLQDAAGYDGQEVDFEHLANFIESGDLVGAKNALKRIYDRADDQYAREMLASDERIIRNNSNDDDFAAGFDALRGIRRSAE